MAHRPISTTKDPNTSHCVELEKIWKATQFEEFPCTCEELTSARNFKRTWVDVADSHIDAAHTYDFAYANICHNWNSRFHMSISNTPHDQIGARSMSLQNK
jgi:hypothetical protein